MKNDNPIQALNDLKMALDNHRNKAKDPKSKRIAFLAVAKAFEVSVEYFWKALKLRAQDDGLDPQSPKAAIMEAAKINIIDNPEKWLGYIKSRNIGAHHYFSINEKDYVELAEEFLENANKAVNKI